MPQPHPMDYRILWTWDSWVCDPFSAESYVSEYRSLIDFAAGTGYNGIIIWGFVDGRHGGVEAARQVAEYGASKGVRILPGVGAGGYHGYSITPGLPYNLDDLLQASPHLRAKIRDTGESVYEAACLYQKEFQDWLRDGAAWLAETFPIGGVNIETNEMEWIDNCEHAAEATRLEPNRLKYANSYSDMAIAVPAIFGEVRAVHPDAWVTYATYEPAWFRRMEDAWLLDKLPREAIAQWNMELDCDPDIPSPVPKNVSLIHSGGWSYHLRSFPPTWTFTQSRCFWPLLGQAKQFGANQRAMGTQGLVLGNVGSAAMPDNEINYIAYLEFSRSPEMELDGFAHEHIARLYGEDAAPAVLRLMLEQERLHPKFAGIWKGWAWLLHDGCPSHRLIEAPESLLAEWEGQIALAEQAWEAATEDGRRRISVIMHVLNEYLQIGRLSRSPRAGVFIREQDTLRREHWHDNVPAVIGLAEDLGLPADIYRFGG